MRMLPIWLAVFGHGEQRGPDMGRTRLVVHPWVGIRVCVVRQAAQPTPSPADFSCERPRVCGLSEASRLARGSEGPVAAEELTYC